MAKHAAHAFDKKLKDLFWNRTHWLRAEVRAPTRGKAPTFSRKKVNKAIDDLKALTTACLIKNHAVDNFAGLYDQKRQWHIKGHGAGKKRRAFVQWFDKAIPHSNCVYVFWARRKCRYVGRTLNGKGRPQSHFDKHWFSGVTRIDILSSKRPRNIPKLECLATHRFEPSKSKIKPSNKKYHSRCPICETHKRVRTEVRSLFKLK